MAEKSPRLDVEGRQVLTACGTACSGTPHLGVDPPVVSGSSVPAPPAWRPGRARRRTDRYDPRGDVGQRARGATPITGLSHVQLLVSDVKAKRAVVHRRHSASSPSSRTSTSASRGAAAPRGTFRGGVDPWRRCGSPRTGAGRAGPRPYRVRRARWRQPRHLGLAPHRCRELIIRESSWRAGIPHCSSVIPTASPSSWWHPERGRRRGEPPSVHSVDADPAAGGSVRGEHAVPSGPPPPERGWYRDSGQSQLRALLGWADVDLAALLGWCLDQRTPEGPPPAVSRPRDVPPPHNAGPSGGPPPPACTFSARRPSGGPGPQTRFYAVATIIAPPVFVVFFTVIAVSALPSQSGRVSASTARPCSRFSSP